MPTMLIQLSNALIKEPATEKLASANAFLITKELPVKERFAPINVLTLVSATLRIN